MRISDWSSDVCSSDLVQRSGRMRLFSARGVSPSWSPDGRRLAYVAPATGGLDVYVADADGKHRSALTRTPDVSDSGPKWSDRKSLVEGKRVSVRLYLGSLRLINKKKVFKK